MKAHLILSTLLWAALLPQANAQQKAQQPAPSSNQIQTIQDLDRRVLELSKQVARQKLEAKISRLEGILEGIRLVKSATAQEIKDQETKLSEEVKAAKETMAKLPPEPEKSRRQVVLAPSDSKCK